MTVTINCPIRASSYAPDVSRTDVNQPGYDALADDYAAAFPSPYLTAMEKHAVAAFAETVLHSHIDGLVVDAGCGLGQVTADLARQGLNIIGVDPSAGMLAFARRTYPTLSFSLGDSTLKGVDPDVSIAAIIARFSLIHSDPAMVPRILRAWAGRLAAGGTVLVACQISEDSEVAEFDHRVAPAWRWHPDRLSAELSAAGFDEVWRIVSRADTDHRFPDVHMQARRR